jgi:ParB-like chromosome segregation protein Spo0J
VLYATNDAGAQQMNSPLRIEWPSPSTIARNTTNPRRHSDRQIKQIAQSIESFGFNVPVLIDRMGKLVAGHGRVEAAVKLGLANIPALRLEHLTEEQARAFMIADNRLAETSTWDDRLLGETLRELSEVDLNFNIEATGFTVGEIDLRIESLDRDSAKSEDDADKLPNASTLPPISKNGDLWQLRDHRI